MTLIKLIRIELTRCFQYRLIIWANGVAKETVAQLRSSGGVGIYFGPT